MYKLLAFPKSKIKDHIKEYDYECYEDAVDNAKIVANFESIKYVELWCVKSEKLDVYL